MEANRGEGKRDFLPTAFTGILESMRLSHPQVIAAVFVDAEGECVDYSSELDPYETKVLGALFLPLVFDFAAASTSAGLGTVKALTVRTDRRQFIARRVSVEYLLVLVVGPDIQEHTLKRVIENTVVAIRHEARIEVPLWETPSIECSVQVQTRAAKGWPFAPELFEEGGIQRRVLAVLGYWQEQGPEESEARDLFRVRSDDGRELTLEFWRSTKQWIRYERRLL
ncbi:MAG: roadblock/LC7 domain-containing protein [Myxococcales bacterium]|nr:MAG: roadblock/LC7 domain-containing protein [Myxococcales bacterium]